MPSPVPCPSPVLRLSVSRSVSPSLCLSLPVCACALVSVCLSVCLSASASRRLGSVSLNLHLFLSLSLLTPGLPRVLWLWPWLPRLRRPAVSRGVGACECLCVCPCACMSLVRSLRKVLCLEGGVGARGASVGRRGGADELWFTALVAPGGFGHRAGAGQDGRSGPRLGCAQARRRLRGPRAPAGPRGHAALSSEALGGGEVAEGRGGLRAGAGLEGPRVGERPDLRAPHPTAPLTPPQPSPAQPSPRPTRRRHAGPAAAGPGSRVPEALWSPGPGRAGRVLAGGGGVRGAERRRPATRPRGVRSRVVQLKCSARSVESCGRLARAAGQRERQAQRRALRAPGGSRPRLRPYHPERARSRLISEAKQGRAWLVLGWETAWEYRVL